MDAELERAIDLAGRDRVFAVMRAAGWHSGDAAPKYVWWHVVKRLLQDVTHDSLI